MLLIKHSYNVGMLTYQQAPNIV